jgi:porphobilinogen deaminase
MTSTASFTTLSVAATLAAAVALLVRFRNDKRQPTVRRVLRLGTRSSDLAMVQTHWVAARLRAAYPDVKVVILKGVDAFGDLQLTQSLKELAAKTPGLFTKELEAGLQLNAYDAVVHSLKVRGIPTSFEIRLSCNQHVVKQVPEPRSRDTEG